MNRVVIQSFSLALLMTPICIHHTGAQSSTECDYLIKEHEKILDVEKQLEGSERKYREKENAVDACLKHNSDILSHLLSYSKSEIEEKDEVYRDFNRWVQIFTILKNQELVDRSAFECR